MNVWLCPRFCLVGRIAIVRSYFCTHWVLILAATCSQCSSHEATRWLWLTVYNVYSCCIWITALPVHDCCLYYISRVECMADFISGRNVNLLSDEFITFVLLARVIVFIWAWATWSLIQLPTSSLLQNKHFVLVHLCSPCLNTGQTCSLLAHRDMHISSLCSHPHLYPVTVMICKGRHRGSTWPGPKWDENSTSIRTSDGNQESARGPWSVPVFGPDYLVMGAVYRSVLNLLSCLQTRLICIKHVFRIQNQADESILSRLSYTRDIGWWCC